MDRSPRRGFAALWASQASSNLADGLLQAAAPLLVASLTRDPLVVAGMTVVQVPDILPSRENAADHEAADLIAALAWAGIA